MESDAFIDELRAAFSLRPRALHAIAGDFAEAMREGLGGRASSLRMLPSFLAPPTGEERGTLLAIDFGGTNVRVLSVELRGRGVEPNVQQHSYPLVDPAGAHDHVSVRADATALFDFLAAKVAGITRPGMQARLGLTFSFPCEQSACDRARLIRWTKEFATRGVEGQDIGNLLTAALHRAGLHGIRPVVILNDTVGTLLSAAYQHAQVQIGAICGTGHNSCYLEPQHPLTGAPMLVNLESGNFDAVPMTGFDAQLDRSSEQPGQQRLEKLVAGKYLGELLRLVVLELQTRGLLQVADMPAAGPRRGDTQVISELLLAGTDAEAAAVLHAAFGCQVHDETNLQRIRSAAALIADRSASLVAATFAGIGQFVGIGQRLAPRRGEPLLVAIDGSIYDKLPGYAANVQRTLDALAGVPGEMVALRAKDGSGIGAAIAAATIK